MNSISLPPLISIIIPVFNEENCLKVSLEATLTARKNRLIPGNCEVVIVDDGSSDQSYDLACQLTANASDVSVIRHSTNLGMGAAYTTGVVNAHGQYLYLHPADSDAIGELASFLPLAGERHMVIGRRKNYRSTHAVWRTWTSRAQRLAFSSALGLDLEGFCGVNLLPAAPLKLNLPRSRTHVATIEAVVNLKRLGLTMLDCPIQVRPRIAGASKIFTPAGVVKAASEMTVLAIRTLFVSKFPSRKRSI